MNSNPFMATVNTPFINSPSTSTPKPPTVLHTIHQCPTIQQLNQLHAHLLRTNLFFDPYAVSNLVAAAVSPSVLSASQGSLDYARKVFDQIPNPNLFTWNTLIRAYASSPTPAQSIIIFSKMLRDHNPNKFTFPFVIKAASALSAKVIGRILHGMAIKASLGSDIFIVNTLIYFYCACGDLEAAYHIFTGIDEKDVVSWNSMINGFSQGYCPKQALEVFKAMETTACCPPNGITMVGVLSACAKIPDLEFGRRVHSYIEISKIGDGLTLDNALLDMYTKCGSVKEAMTVFDRMEKKDIFSWTTMIAGWAKTGNYDMARRFFDETPFQDIAAWNALISGFEQGGRPREALDVFHELQSSSGIVRPNSITLVSALSACSQLGAMGLGKIVHDYIKFQRFDLNSYLGTSLISMYSKCGDLEKGIQVFQQIHTTHRDVYVWSAMIAGFAMHSRSKDAIDYFIKMQEEGIRPNDVTFTNLLTACSHAKLVNEGRVFFDQMEPIYGIVPRLQHYACLVDGLARAGLLNEAMAFIDTMPITPDASVLKAMLVGCTIHGDADLAERVANRLLNLDPDNHGTYVLLSNVYAKNGRWEDVSRLRKMARDSNMKKEPGRSSMEVDGVIHEFHAGDDSHPRRKEMYSKLDEMTNALKSIGYVPDKTHILQMVEEDEVKEHALNRHSEKLAIAFGLISVASSEPIRIIKNLKVCGDCHSFGKLASRLFDREIVLRDRYRFHHFRGGDCSCKDYW